VLKVDLEGTGWTCSPTTLATLTGVIGLDLATMLSENHLIV